MKGLFALIFRSGSIKRSLSVFILFFTVLMTSAIFMITHYYAKKAIADHYLQKYVIYVHKNFEENINEFLNQTNLFARLITVNKALYNTLVDPALTHEAKAAMAAGNVDALLRNSNIVENIVIVNHAGERFAFSKDERVFESVDCSFIRTQSAYDTFLYDHCVSDTDGGKYIVIGKSFINFQNAYNLGYLQLYIKEDYLYSLYANSSLEDSITFLTCRGVTISHPDKTKLNHDLYLPRELIKPDQLNKSVDNQYVVIMPTLKTAISDLEMYSIISYGNLLQTFRNFNATLMLIILINIILSLFIAFFLSKLLANSIVKLQDKMRRYGAGEKVDFSDIKNNELLSLEESFAGMVTEIDGLILKNEEERRRQRVAELAALQAQINPHFVYNVLDAVAWMAKLQDQPEIERMVSAFAAFFRIGLHKGDTVITIAEELKHVESYITIEQIRFPNTFEIVYDVDPAILHIKTVKIILQPLVENCIKHGFSKQNGMGRIRIEGRMQGEYVQFKVIDNGVGLICNPFDAKKGKDVFGGYGVFNIRERIVLEYGESCGLFFEPTPGGGTTAVVIIKPEQ